MLVLLIIFMIVTPALVGGFQAQLPTGLNLKERPDDDERTTMGIDFNGNYYLNKKLIKKENALDLLKAEFLRHPEDRVLFLRADARLKYGEITEAMEVAKQAGARVVAAVTESKPEEEPPGGRR
jgi:biopolymer transport protein ExbD